MKNERETQSLAIIIPHYNDVTRLTRCLNALVPQLSDDDHLIVVDNGSTQDLGAVKARWPELHLVTESQKGAACARNRGASETNAPWILFLDCDCIPDDDWLPTARKLAAAPHADVFGGRVDVFDETPPPRSGAEAFETVFAFDNRHYIENKGFSGSGNLLTRRDVFETTGPFRPGLSEDFDWCHRATRRGFALVYVDILCVNHPTRSDWASLARKWQRLTTEENNLRGQTPRARRRWILKALAMPVSVVPHALRVLRHPELRGMQERLRGIGTLARLRLSRMVWMLGAAAEKRSDPPAKAPEQ